MARFTKKTKKPIEHQEPLQLLGRLASFDDMRSALDREVIGFDIALTSNAIVLYDHQNPHRIFSSEEGPGGQDLDNLIRYFQVEIMERFVQYSGSYVVLDWSKSESFMNTNRVHTSYKSFLTGYVYRALLSQGSFPIILSPQVIRRVLSLKPNAPKQYVWQVFQTFWKGEGFEKMNQHERDALILGWCFQLIYPFQDKTLWP